MKKILFFASAIAGLFFAASCQQENLEPVQQGNTVTYTVQLPDAIGTKAIGTKVSSVTELIYEVYRIDENGDETRLYQMTEAMTNGSATVELELVNNQDFRVLFWAQVPRNGVYTTKSLKSVTLKPNLSANAENYAAFAGQDEITDGKNLVGRTITLVRPVAQLNIATSAESLKLGEDQNGIAQTTVSFKTTGVEVKGLSTTYNVATGNAGADKSTFTYLANLPYDTDPNTADNLSETTIEVNGETYKYVSMNYLGFAQEGGDNVNVSYTIETNEVGTITNTINNVPVKANYRTNIIGNLITATSDYKITLNSDWADELDEPYVVEVVSVSTAADLQEAIDNIQTGTEGNIKLEGNIDLGALAGMISTKADEPAVPTYGLEIPAGKAVVIDLNGNILSQTVKQTGAYSMIQNNGHLTIIDSNGGGKISYTDKGDGGEYVSNTIVNNATMIIESGVIENNSSANVAANGYPHPVDNNGNLTINGGTLSNNANYASMRIWCTTDDNTSVTINGGTFNGSIDFQTPSAAANKGSLTINGGTFNADTYTKCAVRLLGFGADVDEMLGYINGGTFNGEIALRNWSGAEFNSQVFYITGGQFSVDPSAFVVDGYPVVAPEAEGGYFTIGEYTTVAKIGDQEYGSLSAAVDAVEDGGTITLVANETFTKANRYNNGGWWDGLGYSGDKSFTIDLGGYTITQDGSLNDYLIWIKNDGEKDNTITFKNGTMDAGTTAYCAIATASSNKQTITINLENINLINNISNGAVAKIRGGSVLNVKAGTVITGKNSYTGIEAVGNTTEVNIYEGAKIYQNGTSSSWGWLVGASYNATVNVYGGEGKSARGAFGAMTSGGTINISGGEWIANNDGTVANDNKGVLIAQSDKQYNSGAGNAVVNVTGGTFKGGYNCYGNAAGDAQINIMGGNFNSDPSTYLVTDYKAEEANGTWTVVVKPIAAIGDVQYATLEEAAAAAKAGDTITVLRDATLTEEVELPANITFNGNGMQINGSIYAGGNLTFAGHTKVTSFSAAYYNRTITIGEGACLEVNGGGRVSLAYGNIFNIKGNISDAKTADKTKVQPSLIIPAGISITGGNDAAMNVTDAYVQIGSTTSKPGAASGTFSFNFVNSIVEFTKELGFYEPTGAMNPTFNMNLTNTVMSTGTKLCVAAVNSNVVADNSIVALGTYLRNSGTIELKNGSKLSGKTIQFGENGGNNGTITVDGSEFTIQAGSTAHAFDGKGVGSIIVKNSASAEVDYYKDMTITVDETSSFKTNVQ